jgi:hypothetical protein
MDTITNSIGDIQPQTPSSVRGFARAYNSAPKHVMCGNAVLKSDEYETLMLHVLIIT